MDVREHDLVRQWRQCQFHHAPFIFSGDTVLQSSLNDRQVVSLHNGFDDFISSTDFGTTTSQLHLGLLPLPYIGDLSGSDVFILLLNPGFGAGDYYVEQHCAEFREAILRNISQENASDEYPFFFLNPRFSWTGGGIWWQAKLRDIIGATVSHLDVSYQEALRHVSKRVCCLELLPYHSKSYGVKDKVSSQLASIRLARDFVKRFLLPKAEQDEATIVVTRKAAEWGLTEGKNIIVYSGSHQRGAHLTLGDKKRQPSQGGKAIAQRLGLLFSNMAPPDSEGERVDAL